MAQDKWQDVINLKNLEQLNLKIAMDDLNDAIEHMKECREKVEKCWKNLILLDKNIYFKGE